MRVVKKSGELGREERIDGSGTRGRGGSEEELLLQEGGGEDGVLPGARDQRGGDEESGEREVREDVLEELGDGEGGSGRGWHCGVVGLPLAHLPA